MGDNQNWNQTGEQIKGALAEALKSGDFRNLNALVSQTATSVLHEVGIHIPADGEGDANRVPPPAWRPTGQETKGAQADIGPAQPAWNDPKGPAAGGGQKAPVWRQAEQESTKPWKQPGAGGPQPESMQPWQQTIQESAKPWKQPETGGAQAWQQVRAQAQQAGMQAQQTWKQVKAQARPIWQPGAQQTWQNRQRPIVHPAWQGGQTNLPQVRRSADLSLVNMKKVGNVSGVLCQVFGGIGLGITGFVTFVRLLVFASGDTTTLQGWIVNFIFLAVFFGVVRLGVGQKRRLRRARRYASLCDNRMFGEVSYLAKNIGKSDNYVVKDLGKMLEAGIFPEGHFDDNKTCFMLNDTVYRQYLKAEDGRRLREEAERKPAESAQSREAADMQPGTQDAELDTMIAEGMECIRRLRNLNDRISGDGICARLFCLENLLKDIFDSIKERPEQMHRMHKLMDYYLPTTLKLVEAYAEFDQVSAPGEEITGAKAEIENTLDIINQAFTELLNNLFQDAVFDATTDAQVLKTMLAREGLTREMEFATVSRER